MKRYTTRLNLESLESRLTPTAALAHVSPFASGSGVNLSIDLRSLTYSPDGGETIMGRVDVTNPHHVELSFDVKVYWSPTTSVTGSFIWLGTITISTNSGRGKGFHLNTTEQLRNLPHSGHIIAEVNPSHAVGETTYSDNVGVFDVT